MRTLYIKISTGPEGMLVCDAQSLESWLDGHVNRAKQGHLSNAAVKAIDILRWLLEYLLA